MSEQMRAAVLHAPGKLVVEQVAVPEIGPDDVLLRVSACGVCGSDIPRVLTTGTYRQTCRALARRQACGGHPIDPLPQMQHVRGRRVRPL